MATGEPVLVVSVEDNLVCNALYESTAREEEDIEEVINSVNQEHRVLTYKNLKWQPYPNYASKGSVIYETPDIKSSYVDSSTTNYILNTNKSDSTTKITINGTIEGPTIDDLLAKIEIIKAALTT